MAPRRRKKKTYRRKSWSLLNALESYTYSSILSEGILGTSPWSALTGDADIGYEKGALATGDSWRAGSTTGMVAVGTSEISLGDIISQPGQALGVMAENFQSNVIPMAISGIAVGAGFRFGKRLLRRQISSVNRNLVKPMLGAGIRL